MSVRISDIHGIAALLVKFKTVDILKIKCPIFLIPTIILRSNGAKIFLHSLTVTFIIQQLQYLFTYYVMHIIHYTSPAVFILI